MSNEDLGNVLDDSYRQHKRDVAIKRLGERTSLTLEQVSKLVSHPEHGDVVKTITLQELIDEGAAKTTETDDGDEAAAAPPPRRPAPNKKKAAKKATKAPAAKKKAAKKAAKKKAASSNGRKADFGKKKPRLDYEQGCKEVLAALKAHGKPAGRNDLESATGYSAVQVRTFCKRLAENGKIKILGKGGRSTSYAMP
jgi:hypothetical protein